MKTHIQFPKSVQPRRCKEYSEECFLETYHEYGGELDTAEELEVYARGKLPRGADRWILGGIIALFVTTGVGLSMQHAQGKNTLPLQPMSILTGLPIGLASGALGSLVMWTWHRRDYRRYVRARETVMEYED